MPEAGPEAVEVPETPETRANDAADEPVVSPGVRSGDTPSEDPLYAAPVTTRASRWPVAAGLVIGALIGAGSAYAVYATKAVGADGASEKTMSALSDRVAALESRVSQIPDRGHEQTAIADLAKRVSAMETAAKTAQDRATQDQAAQDNVAQAKAPAPAQPSVDLSPLRAQLAALQQSVVTLRQQTPPAADLKATQSKIAGLERALGDVRNQAAAAQSGMESLRSEQKELARTAPAPALAVVADSLIQQIQRGLPFVAQVSALDALGVDPSSVAVLRQSADHGVPSAKTLAAKFEPLTGGLLATAHKAPAGAGFWDRMKDDAANLVSVHRADDLGGDDVASQVANIRAALARDDVSAALASWQDLPAAARAKPQATAWAALAKTHVDAMVAAQAIQTQAIAMLGAKKS